MRRRGMAGLIRKHLAEHGIQLTGTIWTNRYKLTTTIAFWLPAEHVSALSELFTCTVDSNYNFMGSKKVYLRLPVHVNTESLQKHLNRRT